MKSNVSKNFATFNEQLTKGLTIVVKIDGVENELSNRTVYNRVRYGMPGLTYGMDGLYYGGLLKDESALDYLDVNGSSLSIDQSIEPEEGRGSISQMTLSFKDIGGLLTRICSPGIIIPEIQGRTVDVYVGFDEIAWPEDYLKVFRGYVSSVSDTAGKVVLTLSDPNLKNRQEMVSLGSSKITMAASDSDTSFYVENGNSFKPYYIAYDGGIYTQFVNFFIKAGDEWMKQNQLSLIGDDQISGFTRAQRGTTAAAIDVDTEITQAVEVFDHAIDMALKIMLSGRDEPYAQGTEILAINYTGDPITPIEDNVFVLGKLDAVRDLGLTIGDVVYVTGGANDTNVYIIKKFKPYNGYENRLIYVEPTFWSSDLITEPTTVATLGFRSKYEMYPFGMGLTPMDVDVERFEAIRDVFLFQPENSFKIFITEDVENGKDFIEQNIYKPIGAYSVTRWGKISLGLTKPPLAQDGLRILSADNVKNPQSIKVERAISGRKFFNRIDYNYDFNDEGDARSLLKVINLESAELLGITQVLKVDVLGGKSDLQIGTVLEKRAEFLLNRYKQGALVFTLQIMFKEGILIQAGDIVAVRDGGGLLIANHNTGERDLGFQLYEVIRKTIDLKTGSSSVTLVGGVGASATDRFGVISPSSRIAPGSSDTRIILKPSFGNLENERAKWDEHEEEKILVHSEDYSVSGEATIIGFDPSNDDALLISGLAFTPLENYIVDIVPYPTSTNRNQSLEYKAMYCFQSPTVDVADLSADETHVEVGAGDIAKFAVGKTIRVHSYDYSEDSGDIKIISIAGNILEVDDMGFIPDVGDFIDGIGFADGGEAYRFI